MVLERKTSLLPKATGSLELNAQSNGIELSVVKDGDSSNKATIFAGFTENLVPYATAPSTPEGSNSNEVVTADWANRNFKSMDFWSIAPIGLPFMWFANSLPSDRYIFIEGQDLNKNEYPELFNLWGYTFGGSGDIFKCPNTLNQFPMISTYFGNVAAGLPNITGSFCGINYGGNDPRFSGAFTTRGEYNNGCDLGSSSVRTGHNDFSASRSNSIYGSSSTVQPPAFRVRLICRAR